MANYPSSASTDANLYVAVNNKNTTLVGALTASGGNYSATEIEVSDTTGFPSTGFITIDLEIIAYTGVATSPHRFTGITRGQDGSTAASHSNGAFVYHHVIAAHHNVLKEEVKAIEVDLIAKGISASTFLGLGRNRIINGEMRIDQRYGGNAATINTNDDSYTLDMWAANGEAAAGVFTVAENASSGLDGFPNFARVTVTTADASIAAGENYFLMQKIEGHSVRDFLYGTSSAKTSTISFWVRSSLTGTFNVSLTNFSRSYVSTYTINSANTWEQKTITLVGDTSGTWNTETGTGAALIFSLGVGSTYQTTTGSWQAGNFYASSGTTNLISTNAATLDLTGVQLEIGSSATPFEYRPFVTELQLCQRYFEKSYNFNVNPGTNTSAGRILTGASTDSSQDVHVPIFFKVNKRTTPATVTFYTTSGTVGNWDYDRSGSGGTASTTSDSVGDFGMTAKVSNIGAAYVVATVTGHWTADASL